MIFILPGCSDRSPYRIQTHQRFGPRKVGSTRDNGAHLGAVALRLGDPSPSGGKKGGGEALRVLISDRGAWQRRCGADAVRTCARFGRLGWAGRWRRSTGMLANCSRLIDESAFSG